MKRIGLVACAMVLGVMVSAPAKADVSVIMWNGSRICQIWDNASGTTPWPNDYVVMATGFANWADAFVVLNGIIASRRCGW